MTNQVTFHIKIASPIHIGCGEDYEPTSFIIDEEHALLTAFDPLDFVRSLHPNEKVKLTAISAKGTVESLLEIYLFMRHKKFSGSTVSLSKGVLDHYQKTLALKGSQNIKNEINKFAIARTAYDPYTKRPYIPGSAIKGALRTAWLNMRQSDMHLSQYSGKAIELEKQLLDGGSFATDPLRMLKVSDFQPVGRIRTQIVYAVNVKKKLSNKPPQGLYQILEVIESGSCFEGTITVEKPLKKAGITNPLTLEKILLGAKNFYASEQVREAGEMQHVGISAHYAGSQDETVFLRLGHHSGAECVTIAGHRNIKIMQKRGDQPRYDVGSTTFWFAAQSKDTYILEKLLPFGWVHVNNGPAPDEAHKNDEKSNDQLPSANVSNTNQALATQVKQALPKDEIWDKAYLEWSPGDETVKARAENKTALGKGKEIIHESLRERVIVKRKAVAAKVTVAKEGNAYRIVSIVPVD